LSLYTAGPGPARDKKYQDALTTIATVVVLYNKKKLKVIWEEPRRRPSRRQSYCSHMTHLITT